VVSIKTSIHLEKYRRPQLKKDVLFTNNMGCAKNTFSKVGYFDEYLCFAAEDNDWSYRALRLGITIAYVPEIIAIHEDWRNQDQIAATLRSYAYGQGGFYGKHLRKGDWFIGVRILIGITQSIIRLLLGILTNNRELRSNGMAILIYLIPGIRAGFSGSNEDGHNKLSSK
jgi:GT2 family glycosyltransferase